MSKKVSKVFSKTVVGATSKPVAKLVSKIPGGEYIVPAIATAVGGPVGGALASGYLNFGRTGNITNAALAAGGSYLGSQFGGNIFGNLGTVGNGLVNTFGQQAGNTLASGLGGLADASISSALGSFAGNKIGESVGNSMTASRQDPTNFQPFRPARASAQNLPSTLGGFGGLNTSQQATNIANKGVFGGGLGSDENSYFLNLVNRQLVNEGGGVNDISSLPGIESSYLQKLGLGGYNNSNDLLEAISKWGTA